MARRRLTYEQFKEIKRWKAVRDSVPTKMDLAREYGVSDMTIARVELGQSAVFERRYVEELKVEQAQRAELEARLVRRVGG